MASCSASGVRASAAACASTTTRAATVAAARPFSSTSAPSQVQSQATASTSAAAAAAGSSNSADPTVQQQQRRQKRALLDFVGQLGSTQTRHTAFRPHKTRLEPLTAKELTLSHLLASTAQVGHTLSSFARANQANVYGVRHKLAIIDVEKATLPALRRAAAVVRSICERDGVILILGTRPGQQAAVLSAAKRLGENGYHVTTDRWLPGSITNAPKLLSGSVNHALASSPSLHEPTSSSSSSSDGNSPHAPPNSIKLAAQTLQPDLLIVLNPVENLHAIREATQCNIPTMAIIDTDVDPRTVTYPIPANDDSLRAVELIVGVLSKAGEQGLKDRQRKLDEQDKLLRKAARGRAVPLAANSSSSARAAAGPRNEFTEARDAETQDFTESTAPVESRRNPKQR
ncbi:unnamed protein product [Tilletia controversa]|uniref:30S ribosomal protein S2 n=1 Tax=Tilletia controversa TaxID=13291 RepID=A0A8X7SZF1_9BASI|nr:hypothetical protein CF328_g956 [Tilletia controversa]KAE8253662.1 hypothetical protein A4X06_0g1296 [Tilletia controversa]CAD6897755.1 unnamed protein product [Tilletia controversa]